MAKKFDKSDEIKLVKFFVFKKVSAILGTTNDAAARATLAKLRRGIGHAPGQIPELWNITLEGMPEELMSRDGTPTYGEWASYTALTLFALHQQGHDTKAQPMNKEGNSLGNAVGMLVKSPEDEVRVKRRFDAAVASDSMDAFAYYIRGLIQLMKAEGIPLDYPALAVDLYLLQIDAAKDRVRLKWGQDFYRKRNDALDDNAENNGGK